MHYQTVRISLLAMIVLLLAACGGGDAPTPAPTAVPPTATPVPPPAPSTATPAPAEQASTGSAAGAPAAADVRTFVIDPAQSEVRFIINEVLLGAPTEVKGVTSQLTGTIQIDLGAPANTTISPIVIDARDLKTDRGMRDRTIRRFILQSGEDKYQFITFTPTSITGLPAAGAAWRQLLLRGHRRPADSRLCRAGHLCGDGDGGQRDADHRVGPGDRATFDL